MNSDNAQAKELRVDSRDENKRVEKTHKRALCRAIKLSIVKPR